jgi:signal transduction histidine kinase
MPKFANDASCAEQNRMVDEALRKGPYYPPRRHNHDGTKPRRAASDALEAHATDYQRLFESVPGPHLVMATDFTVLAVSDGFVARAGVPPQAIVGRNRLALEAEAFGENDAALGTVLRQVLDDNAPRTIPAPGGRRVLVPVMDTSGALVAIIESFREAARDHAETEQLRRALADTTRELDAFSHSVSHDLRAPLRSIQGFSRIVLEDYAALLPETGQQHVQRVVDAATKMSALIDDLLQLSRMGRMEMKQLPIDLTALAESVWKELEAAEPERGVAFTLPRGLMVAGDRRLLRVALRHLLANAWKFTSGRRDAHVELGKHERDGEPVFYVRDNGVGFNQMYADRLFSPFQRLHAAHEFPGSGMGLATVQRVIHRHGGRVWAEGTIGGGATVSFTIPGDPSAYAAAAATDR